MRRRPRPTARVAPELTEHIEFSVDRSIARTPRGRPRRTRRLAWGAQTRTSTETRRRNGRGAAAEHPADHVRPAPARRRGRDGPRDARRHGWGETHMGDQGVHLNPLGLFLRTSYTVCMAYSEIVPAYTRYPLEGLEPRPWLRGPACPRRSHPQHGRAGGRGHALHEARHQFPALRPEPHRAARRSGCTRLPLRSTAQPLYTTRFPITFSSCFPKL